MALKTGGKNKRRDFKRIEIEITVKYKPLNHSNWYTTVTRGLGSGGVCLISKEYLGQGTEMKIQLPLPGSETTIVATGLVVWSAFLIDQKVYESGITFPRLNDGEKRALAACIEDHVGPHPYG